MKNEILDQGDYVGLQYAKVHIWSFVIRFLTLRYAYCFEEILSWFCHGMESLESRIKNYTKYLKH